MQKAKSFLLINTSCKSTQILIPNQLEVGNIFALKFRNLLIIIILALYSAGTNEALKSFFFQAINSISAPI